MNLQAPIKIIIADDHELIRDGLQVMMKKVPAVEILGEAYNGEMLVKMTRKLSPEVILTDIKMPVMDGIEATKLIKQEFPHIGIIALSSYDEGNLIIQMLKAGAKGFLLKTASKPELLEAILKVYHDESYYCSNTKDKLSDLIARSSYHPVKGSASEQFTERELQVIKLICDGFSSKQIASELKLKPRTIESYREKIMEKMDVKNSAALVRYALDHELVKHGL